MSRTLLIKAIGDCTSICGYHFFSGEQYQMDTEINHTPALWMLPCKLKELEGYDTGIISYAVSLILIHDCPCDKIKSKEQLWGRMENDALHLNSLLSRHIDIVSIKMLGYSTSEYSYTSRGEVSMTVEFEIQVPSKQSCKI